MKLIRYIEVIKYGWKHSAIASKNEDCPKTRLYVFSDIISCYLKYKLWSNQYLKEKFYKLNKSDRDRIGLHYFKKNTLIDEWYDEFYKNNAFISKYSIHSYEDSLRKRKKRLSAYTKQYKMGRGAYIEYGVTISKQHYSDKELLIGEKCHLGRELDIDYTGGLIIGNGVSLLEGVKVLTHGHDFLGMCEDNEFIPNSNRAFATPLKICDNVIVCTRALIMPGVKEIGENSIISAGAVVTKKVPANCIVAGNPAKIIARDIDSTRVYYDYIK